MNFLITRVVIISSSSTEFIPWILSKIVESEKQFFKRFAGWINLRPIRKRHQILLNTIITETWDNSNWLEKILFLSEPLPVSNLEASEDDSGTMFLSWLPNPESTQNSYSISYHEVESVTGDSNTITTNKTTIELEALLPGRNYTLSVQAVSKDAHSDDSYINIVTRPSAPIIEDLKPIIDGLNISWKSDVNSRQDRYEIQWIRNDTNDLRSKIISDSKIILPKLYPGAGYLVKVFAISHGLKSEPHEYFQPVCKCFQIFTLLIYLICLFWTVPRPPRNMSLLKITTNSVIVQWSAPLDSLISEYAIRYRSDSDNNWVKLPPVHITEAEVADMTAGEKYTIQVNTVSYGLESNEPQQLNHTVREYLLSMLVYRRSLVVSFRT